MPPELHATLKHADALPLFQMIAKNVGIRRARGQFVLSTNIDILLSDELMDMIAGGTLQPGVMYRVDRRDVGADVPVNGSLDELMTYCRTHQIRTNTRWGTFPLDRAGTPALWSDDIVEAPDGIRFGQGWHMREGASGEPFRWVSERADLVIAPLEESRVLNIEVESNPFLARSSVDFSITDDESGELLPVTTLSNIFSAPTTVQVIIPASAGERRLSLHGHAREMREQLPLHELRDRLIYRVRRIYWDAMTPRWRYVLEGWRASADSHARVERTDAGVSVVTAPTNLLYAVEHAAMTAPISGRFHVWITLSIAEGSVAIQVLRGDRDGFLPITSHFFKRGPNLYECEIIVDVEAQQPFWFVISNAGDDANRSSCFSILEVNASHPQKDVMDVASLRQKPLARWKAILRERLGASEATADVVQPASGEAVVSREDRPARPVPSEFVDELLAMFRPENLHMNACGDFQLMSREDWFKLRGFAEFEMYSMNIDGLICHTAHYAGVREQILQWPACAYHIEHETGSGWTPEGEAKLRRRIEERGIGWLDSRVVSTFASLMKSVDRPMIFNGPNWGFAQHQLPETVLKDDAVTR